MALGVWYSLSLISSTGTWCKPINNIDTIPIEANVKQFRDLHIHTKRKEISSEKGVHVEW